MNEELREAEEGALAAARRSGVTVSSLEDHAALRAGADLLNRVWRADPSEPVATYPLLRTYVYSGNYVVGAFRGSRLVAIAVGFLGPGGQLHSDLVGVLPDERGKGVGFAVKQHQRAWAIRHGLAEVRWTFDPLIRRNARFNLQRLGASAVAYLHDFYGRLTDGLNALDETDRIAVHWQVCSDRAVRAARGRLPDIDPDALRGGDVVVDSEGNVSEPASGAQVRLVAVPADIEGLAIQDRERSARWRRAVRSGLAGALADGYQITDFSADGSYVLRRVAATAERSAERHEGTRR
jgi:predicted GNAT superfamily acetyltransferase